MHTNDELPNSERLLRVDPDIVRLTTLGRSTIYREIASGRLRTVRIGRAVRVRRDDLNAWLYQNTDGGASTEGEGGDRSDGSPL